MLKADSINELYSMLNHIEPGQIIQVPIKLLLKLWKKAENPIYVQNFEQSKQEIIHCENKDQAQALADFLWNEKYRHYGDIHDIIEDLNLLKEKWNVEPHKVIKFVKP